MMVHLVWVILSERGDDLIEARKQSRLVFVNVLVVVTILTAIVDLYLIAVWPKHASLIKAATIWPAVAAGFFWIMQASKDNFVMQKSPKSIIEEQRPIAAKNKLLFLALQKQIRDDHIYLHSDLTITKLATNLGVTSHRLREMINQSLGYENFNQFINSLRISAILKKFDDPKYDHIPILTLALDGGFRSLSPFNKAFKETVGKTPSQYRKSR